MDFSLITDGIPAKFFAYSMGGIDDQVQNDLSQLIDMAWNRW